MTQLYLTLIFILY